MNSSTPNRCQKCGGEIAPGTRAGLCPRCLMAMNLATETVLSDENVGPGGTKIVTATPQTPPSPEEIAQHFPQLEILECLGRGGMGVVYKARQPQLNRFVALKLLAPEKKDDPQFAERFLREAQALAQLSHPNIVTVYDFGRTDGLFYLLMEFVDGITLRKLLETERIASREALAIVPQICDALQYAHDQGIVHRDIKPENILLGRRGQVKVADFGLAKLIDPGTFGVPPSGGAAQDEHQQGMLLTEAGKVMGTPQYMAPEQRENPAEVDHRADIYALGVVFYQMLTGELPGKRIEPPSKKVQIDVRLDEVVLRALEKQPERRYQQASQIKGDVETIATTTPASSGGGKPAPIPDNDQSRTTSAGGNEKSRLSRVAVAGAIAIPLSFLPLVWVIEVLSTYARRASSGDIHANWAAIIATMSFFSALALTAPVLTSVLGWVAVSQIRRSAGRLRGLKLALLDGLLFPMLALNMVLLGLWMITAKAFAIHVLQIRDSLFISLFDAAVWILVALGSIVWANVTIIRRVWNAVRLPSSGTNVAGRPGPGADPNLLGWAAFVFGILSGLLGSATWFFMPNPPQPLVWSILIAALLGIALGYRTRSDWSGKTGLWIGSINAGIWLIVAVVGAIIIPPQASTNKPASTATSEMPLQPFSGAPFIATVPDYTVEIIAVRPHGSTNEAAWRPDGSSFSGDLPPSEGQSSAAGKIMREVVYEIRPRDQDCSVSDLKADPQSAATALGCSSSWKRDPELRITAIQRLACPPSAKQVNLFAGVACGRWEAVATISANGGETQVGLADGTIWQTAVDYIRAADGSMTTSVRYTVNPMFASQVVAIKNDGTAARLKYKSLTGSFSMMYGMSILSAQEASQIKEFQLQRRPYRWVEFVNVSLVPGHRTSIGFRENAPKDDTPKFRPNPELLEQASNSLRAAKESAATLKRAAESASPVRALPPRSPLPPSRSPLPSRPLIQPPVPPPVKDVDGK